MPRLVGYFFLDKGLAIEYNPDGDTYIVLTARLPKCIRLVRLVA